MRTLVFVMAVVVLGAPVAVTAGPVTGRVELPDKPGRTGPKAEKDIPELPPISSKGFLERIDNPYAAPKKFPVMQHLVVVLEGDGKVESPPALSWDLAGESFGRPVVAVAVGGEVVIKNSSKVARNLVAAEDPKLIPAGPINPTGPKSFRPTESKVYTIGDKDAPHLKGVLVVVPTKYIATVDASGKFDFGDVPEGSYKLRVFFRSGWLELEQPVNVGGKKTEVSVQIPAGYPLKK